MKSRAITSCIGVLLLCAAISGCAAIGSNVYTAASNNHMGYVRTRVERGDNVNVRGEFGMTPLYMAVVNKNPEMAKYLLAHGADPELPSSFGATPLLTAVYRGNTGMVRILIEAGANVNVVKKGDGATPLTWCGAYGNGEIATMLVDAGANIDARDNRGKTAADYARESGKDEVLAVLDRGVVSQPLTAAIMAGDVTLIKEMLAKGVQPTVQMMMLVEGRHPKHKDVYLPEIAALIKPELLRRQMLRAQAAVEAAQSAEDYRKAIAEYNLAKEIAPESPEIYYNLGMVMEKSGAYADAIVYLRKYLELSPAAADSQEVRDMIYKLEYKRDNAGR